MTIIKKTIKCTIIYVNTNYENDSSRTTVKLKPYGSNNFYLHEKDIDETTLAQFISAQKTGKELKFTFELSE